MNKKIKIIELLQDFADEKEIIMPKYIKYWDRIGHKDEVMLVCKENIIDKLNDCEIDLNDEVEILEDNTEEIEELDLIKKENIWDKLSMCEDKINELVRAVKEIRKDLNK